MNENCVSGVPGAKVLTSDDLIDIEKHHLDHGHHDEHQGAGCADDDTERDEDTGAGEVSTDQCHQVYVYPGSPWVTQFVVNQLNNEYFDAETCFKL